MTNHATNLFIVDDNRSMVTVLKLHLENKFGSGLNIFTFYDGESCLEKVNENTEIVILDYQMKGKNGIEILRSIKEINPKTEVIMLSGNDNVTLAIESFQNGAKEYIVKGASSWSAITSLVNQILTEPIRRLIKEFRKPKFLGILMLTHNVLAFVSVSALNYLT